MATPLCIYHGGCADGFTAAWIVSKFYNHQVDLHYGAFGAEPPWDKLKGRTVIMVDFSYKRDVLLRIIEHCDRLYVLDHHESAKRDLEDLRFIDNTYIFFDMTKSGALLTWEHFHSEKPPRLVRYVSDRDLGNFRLRNSREINAYIFSWDYSMLNWDTLSLQLESDQGFERAVHEGVAIERKHHKDVAELVGELRRYMTIDGHRVPVASLPKTMTSDAGKLMAQGHPFAACYWDTEQHRVFSLRSLPPGGVNVAVIAEKYGGGGHADAAGFRIGYQYLNALGLL